LTAKRSAELIALHCLKALKILNVPNFIASANKMFTPLKTALATCRNSAFILGVVTSWRTFRVVGLNVRPDWVLQYTF
jgi:hypothetical protein